MAFPRISPQLEHLGSASQAFDEGAVLVGEGGWGLGPGWESLQVLKLARLSQNGVSRGRSSSITQADPDLQAKTLATHLRMLCSRITPTITLLDISTHFLDSNMLSSIGQYGELGSLRRLILATTGTRLTADGLKQALEGCPALESFVLKDGEGKLCIKLRRSYESSLSKDGLIKTHGRRLTLGRPRLDHSRSRSTRARVITLGSLII